MLLSYSLFRLPSLTDQVASPACKNSLERRLTTKSQELQQMRERYKNSEDRENTMKVSVKSLKFYKNNIQIKANITNSDSILPMLLVPAPRHKSWHPCH